MTRIKILVLNYRRLTNFGFFLTLVLSLSCQKKPSFAPASDNLSASEPPPMGATTYNDELKRELSLLDDLFAKRISAAKLSRINAALMNGKTDELPNDKNSDDAHLVKILLALPELVEQTKALDANDQKWLKAKFFFLNRRFVEAATLMTEILQQKDDAKIRNWRARAIFFLGNPDLAVKELRQIIDKYGEKSDHGLDALYLIGAISYESNDPDRKRISAGIAAWKKYLTLASVDKAMQKEINDGLGELQQRLLGEKSLETPGNNSAEKNAILRAFQKEELLLALELANLFLKNNDDAEIATTKARILFKTGRLDESCALFSEIVKRHPNYAPGHHYRGMTFMMQGKPKDAISSWQKVLAIDANYGNAHGLKQRIAVAEKMVQPQTAIQH